MGCGKHTPKPWVDGNTADSIVTKEPSLDAGMGWVADAYRYYGGNLVCESVAPKNKALIEAAPDLLEAAEGIMDKFEKFGANGMVLGKSDMAALVAAIKKAKGEV